MTRKNKILYQLAKKATTKINSREYFYTGYLPTINNSKLSVQKKLKSQIIKTFRNHSKLKSFPHLYQVLFDNTNQKVKKIKLKNGLAVFIKFSYLNGIKNQNIDLITLNHQVQKQVFLGKTYLFNQLITEINQPLKAYIIDLEHQKSCFFFYNSNNLKLISKLNNQFITSKIGEYLEKFSPTKKDQIFYSSGADKTKRRHISQRQYFLNQIQSQFKLSKNKWPLIIFYSQKFTPLIKKFKKNLQKMLNLKDIYLVSQNLQTKRQIKKQTDKKLKKIYQRKKNQKLKKSRQNFHLFQQGWYATIKADGQKKIHTLFIKNKAHKKGYILNQNLLFTYPVKNSKMVNNLAPFLIRNCLINKAEILLFNQSGSLKQSVSASLRY